MNEETSTVEVTDAPADDALFDAGFAGDESIPTDDDRQPEGEQPEQQQEPKYVQITEDVWNGLLAKAQKIDDLNAKMESGLSKAFGKIGGQERTVNELRQRLDASPTGTLELTEDELSKLEFPEVMREALPFIQSKMRFAAPAAAEAAPFDPQQIETLAEKIADKKLVDMSMENLDDEMTGWREIVGLPDTEGKIPDTAYRKWLATQQEDYRTRVTTTNNGAVIGRSIKLFQKAEAEAAAKHKRQDRFSDAVQPRGTGEHQPGSKADDDFEAGFQSG